jgi:hypothetical protein
MFFFISGSITGLLPGVPGQLNLTVENPNNFVIDVQALAAGVAGVDPAHASCPTNSVAIAPYQGHLAVPRNGSVNWPLTITLSSSAPDSCQGAQYALSYTGMAVK